MDHKTFLAALTPDQRADLTRRSDAPGLRHLAGHVGAILLCGAWIASGLPFWQGAMLLQGILLVFLFTLMHEASHETPFASVWINRVAAQVCGVLLFIPATWFRYFHLAHHKYTQVPGKDPELGTPKPQTWRQYVAHVSGIPLWLTLARNLVRQAMGRCNDDYIPMSRRARVTAEARIYLAIYSSLLIASLGLQSTLLVTIWLVPMVLGQPFLRLYLLAEHGRCAFVANMLENTRTTFTNRAVRWLAWNMPYHAEHHSYPAVPFHQLPRLHGLMAPHLRQTASGYTRFSADYAAGLTRSASEAPGAPPNQSRR